MSQSIKTLLIWFAIQSLSQLAMAQSDGFFRVYERPDRDFYGVTAIETRDGNLIVAMYDGIGAGEMALLSRDGMMIRRVQISDTGIRSGMDQLFHDPEQPDLFYGIGEILDPETENWRPYLIHFDGSLDMLSRKTVELPVEYKNIRFSREVLSKNNGILFGAALDQENDYHRLYMLISFDGTVETMVETDTDASVEIRVDGLCESPVVGNYYEYRPSTNNTGNKVKRLYSFDDTFNFEFVMEYDRIDQWIANELYSQCFLNPGESTMKTLDDSTLLFADQIWEIWRASNGSVLKTDHSMILFSTDLAGGMKDQLVVGSKNDTTDRPFHFNALAITNGRLDGERLVYSGCYGYFYPPRPNHITLTKTDCHLNALWQRSYSYQNKYLTATYLMDTNDGGCVVVGNADEDLHCDPFVLKVNPDGWVGSDEIRVESRLMYYPNPVGEVLQLQCSPDITIEQVELYDMLGRRVLTQDTGNERIGMGGLPAGPYTLRVILNDGTTFTDKVVKQ